jgi:hypothetical protein
MSRSSDRSGTRDTIRFDALVFTRLEQAMEVDAAPRALGCVPRVVMEQFGVTAKPCQDFGRAVRSESLVDTVKANKALGKFRSILRSRTRS